MSRGHGKLQNYLTAAIRRRRKPMTFEDIRVALRQDFTRQGGKLEADAKPRPSMERSLRRALQGLARDKYLMVIGEGGRGDPRRYFLHPFVIGMMGKSPEARALQKTLEAEVRRVGDGARVVF